MEISENKLNIRTEFEGLKFLDKERAAFRSRCIEGNLKYKILFSFEKLVNTYKVYQEVEFKLKENAFKNEEIFHFFIDYDSLIQPNFVQINEKQLNLKELLQHQNGIFLNLPLEFLKEGEKNTLIFEFENKFVNDGNGLYNFIDIDQK